MNDPTERIDALVENHGTLTLLRPVSTECVDWIEEHLPEDRLTFGGAVVVEPRYVLDIVFGMKCAGLVIKNG